MRNGTTKRSIRIPEPLWRVALAIAKRRGDTLNAVIRAALERYVAENGDVGEEASGGQ
jgi:hypothetical protein